MWNLKNNINKQTKQKQTTENRLMFAEWRGVGGLGAKDEGIEKYRLVVGKIVIGM